MDDLRLEVESRLGRPFEQVQDQLCELFGRDWEECEIFISTSADKKSRTEVDVIVDLIAKAEAKPSSRDQIRRKVVRWVGKPWRERSNPWDRFKDRVPPAQPPKDDLEEWPALRMDK